MYLSAGLMASSHESKQNPMMHKGVVHFSIFRVTNAGYRKGPDEFF